MKQKEEILKLYSPLSLLQKLQSGFPRGVLFCGFYAMNKGEQESEVLYKQLVENEIDLSAFAQRYKKLRTNYHRRALLHLAAKTSLSDA
ncbi:hypothetical protein Taro_011196 [Colocasia esculenta]|uniref:VPS37 C-terminal domain-containing protein n=1 Tax=Colocasia esculenta TaxID=4460 RepID=A0A843U5F0_COLES|nr:hypothetical protein [Colocasia esculenta]